MFNLYKIIEISDNLFTYLFIIYQKQFCFPFLIPSCFSHSGKLHLSSIVLFSQCDLSITGCTFFTFAKNEFYIDNII